MDNSNGNSNNRANQTNHQNPAKFYLILSIYLIAVSILAVYTTTAASEYGLEKDDLQTQSLTHLLKSTDWLSDYEEQRLGEKILQADIDNVNLTLHSTNNNNDSHNFTAANMNSQQAKYYLHKYQSYIETLHANKTVEGSLANLRSKVEAENSAYVKSIDHISEVSKIITTYELVTILLIIGAGLGGIAEIAKNRIIGYSGFISGGIGIIILLVFLLVGTTV